MFARASHMRLLRAGSSGGPGNFMLPDLPIVVRFRSRGRPRPDIPLRFLPSVAKALAFESDFAHKLARFALALVRARRDPGWRGPRCGARVPPNEAGRASRKSSIPHARIAQLEGQMTVNHRVA